MPRPCNASAYADEGVSACRECLWLAAPCPCEFVCAGCGLCHRRDEQDAFDAPEGSYCEACALDLVIEFAGSAA